MKIEELKPYARNAKKHPDKQIKQIANSIKEFGFNQPIVIDKNKEIIVGHGRYEAGKLLGLTDVPIIQADQLTEEQIKAYRLADNKLNESEWDMGLAIEELKGLSDEMFDLTGFDKDLLIEPDAKDDLIPENAPAISKLGDIYQLGNHRVLCGDSTKIEDVERLMDGKKADIVFTDPPYNMHMGGGGVFKETTRNVEERIKDLIDFNPKNIPFLKINSPTFYIFCSKELIKIYLDIFYDYTFNLLIWCKTNPTPWCNNTFLPDIEYLLYFSNGESIWNNALEPTSVYKKYKKNEKYEKYKKWFISNKLEGRKDFGDLHPTMKPVDLIVDKIRISSNKNGIVLDLFGGSGSTLIACEKTNRIGYLMELDEKYADVIIQRYVDYTNNENIIKNGDKIIWKKSEKTQ